MRKGLLLLNPFQDQPCQPQAQARGNRGEGRNGFGSWRFFSLRRAAWREPAVDFGGQDQCGQATKGVWGMSWRQEAMKGVEDCDKPGEAVTRAIIPGYPNDPELNP